jgi:hypothetical protein
MANSFALDSMSKLVNCFYIFTFLTGIVFNLLAFMVYSGRNFSRHSSAIYFKAMSLNDFAYTLVTSMDVLYFAFDVDLQYNNYFLCKFYGFIFASLSPVSNYLLVFISLDRFIKIKFPHKFAFINKKKFQLSLILLNYVFNFLFYMVSIWNTKILQIVSFKNQTNVTSNLSYTYNYICFYDDNIVAISDMMDLFNSTIVPFALLILISIVMIFVIFKSRLRSSAARSSSSRGLGSSLNVISSKDRKFALTTISLNVLFLLLTLPATIFTNFSRNFDDNVEYIINRTLVCVLYFNYSIGFFVQLAFNSIFRDELLRILKLTRIIKPNSEQKIPTKARVITDIPQQSSV